MFMFNWHFLSILNGLDVIRLFLFARDFSTGGEMSGVLGQNDPQNVKWEKIVVGRALSYAKLRLLSHCAWNYLYPFGLCRCARKKAGRKAGRKKSHMKCIFHVCVEQPLAGGFQPNLAHVFVSRTSPNVQSFIVITWEVSELYYIFCYVRIFKLAVKFAILSC